MGRRIACCNFSNCSLDHSPIGFRLMERISLSLSAGSFATLKSALPVENFRLCSSEYSSPLYSNGLPLMSVAVCRSSNPTRRHIFSMRRTSFASGNHAHSLSARHVSLDTSFLYSASFRSIFLRCCCCISNTFGCGRSAWSVSCFAGFQWFPHVWQPHYAGRCSPVPTS